MKLLYRTFIAMALLASPSITRADEAADKATALANIGQLTAAMSNFQADCGELPVDSQGLNALLADPGFKGWNGPYAEASLLVDPWKMAYRYQLTKGSYEIRSAGPDKKFNTGDDVVPGKPKK
jgi:type II secretory pathway pseudopilin PulG